MAGDVAMGVAGNVASDTVANCCTIQQHICAQFSPVIFNRRKFTPNVLLLSLLMNVHRRDYSCMTSTPSRLYNLFRTYIYGVSGLETELAVV